MGLTVFFYRATPEVCLVWPSVKCKSQHVFVRARARLILSPPPIATVTNGDRGGPARESSLSLSLSLSLSTWTFSRSANGRRLWATAAPIQCRRRVSGHHRPGPPKRDSPAARQRQLASVRGRPRTSVRGDVAVPKADHLCRLVKDRNDRPTVGFFFDGQFQSKQRKHSSKKMPSETRRLGLPPARASLPSTFRGAGKSQFFFWPSSLFFLSRSTEHTVKGKTPITRRKKR